MDGNKIIKGIVAVIIFFALVGALSGGDEPATSDSSSEISTVHETTSLPASKEPVQLEEAEETKLASTVDDEYQDADWRRRVGVWAPVISSDLTNLGASLTNMEFDKIGNDAFLLESSCTMALEDSQKYTVSPGIQAAKKEYESSLSDFIKAAEQTQLAMEEIENNDIDAATEYLNIANSYTDSGAVHMNNAVALV